MAKRKLLFVTIVRYKHTKLYREEEEKHTADNKISETNKEYTQKELSIKIGPTKMKTTNDYTTFNIKQKIAKKKTRTLFYGVNAHETELKQHVYCWTWRKSDRAQAQRRKRCAEQTNFFTRARKTRHDSIYDLLTHTPFGRVIKVG